ncbi:MAG TPA: hypothetical protein V6D29_01345 [Leptolyngbyaceae cyanobacterium]
MPLYRAILTTPYPRSKLIYFAALDEVEADHKLRTLLLGLGALDPMIGILEGPHLTAGEPWLIYRGWADAKFGTLCPELLEFEIYRESYYDNRLKVAGTITPEEALWLLPF